jgi:hypothetical protein
VVSGRNSIHFIVHSVKEEIMGIMACVSFASDYDDVITFLTRCQRKRRVHCSLAVLVLAHEASRLTRRYLLPYVEYWHYRTADTVDFVFPGYVGDPSPDDFAVISDPYFSPPAFVETVARLEGTGWKYKGTPSVIFVSVVRPHGLPYSGARLETSEFIEFDLSKALRSKVIESAPAFFEMVIRVCVVLYAELSDRPLNAGTDQSLGDVLRSALLNELGTKGSAKDQSLTRLFSLHRCAR